MFEALNDWLPALVAGLVACAVLGGGRSSALALTLMFTLQGCVTAKVPSVRLAWDEDRAVAWDTVDGTRQLAEGAIPAERVAEAAEELHENARQTMGVLGGAPADPRPFRPEASAGLRSAAVETRAGFWRDVEGYLGDGATGILSLLGLGGVGVGGPLLMMLLRNRKAVRALVAGIQGAKAAAGNGDAARAIASAVDSATTAAGVDALVRKDYRRLKDRSQA